VNAASASLLETWIGEAERRTWFLFETTRDVGSYAVQVKAASDLSKLKAS
jgi:hypothetical protein